MNVYIKLQEARAKLSEMELKKTGENKFSKYKYYELGDFLPAITKICHDLKLCSFINFEKDTATLSVVDAEKPDQVINFTSTVEEANLKGCHAIQNLGAVQTYLRRYLYMNAFEIVESDIIDETNNNNENKNKQQTKPITKPITNYKEEITKILIELYGDKAKEKLKEVTSFVGKDGKEVAGVDGTNQLSDARAQATYGKLKALYKETAGKEWERV